MASNLQSGFVNLQNLVSEVLLQIGDTEEKKYQALVLQQVINTIRDLNVNFSSQYEETPLTLDTDTRMANWPSDCVKAISVGIYRNGEFWSFTKRPEMAKTSTDWDEGYDEEIGEGADIPNRGSGFGARGRNFGYWVDDDKNCRVIVRNYQSNKVILRYRSNGIKCTSQTCIPYIAKDLITNMVVYHLAIKNIPKRLSGTQLMLLRDERSRHYDQYTEIEYIPQNFDEFMDAQWASMSTVPRRG